MPLVSDCDGLSCPDFQDDHRRGGLTILRFINFLGSALTRFLHHPRCRQVSLVPPRIAGDLGPATCPA